MRPRTLRRRGQFYRRKRSHWMRNLALLLTGAALVGLVVVGMRSGAPIPTPDDAAKPAAALGPTVLAAQNGPAALGSAALAATASAPIAAPRPARSGALAKRHEFDSAAGRMGASAASVPNVTEHAPLPGTTAPAAAHAPTPPAGDEVPF